MLPYITMFQKPNNKVLAHIKHKIIHFYATFNTTAQVRKNELLVNCSELTVGLLVFVGEADFGDDVENLWWCCTFCDGDEEVAHILFLQVYQKIGISMAEIAYILLIKGKRVHEKKHIGRALLVLATNFNQFLQYNMLLLHIIILQNSPSIFRQRYQIADVLIEFSCGSM